jgi:tryptophanyl-tRNA synthetase
LKERVLSGMQASGLLHIGNLIGALRNWVLIQDKFDCFFFIADWHALTTNYAHPEMIKKSSDDLILNFLSAGLDPKKCVIFQQSKVLQHAELHLLLSMITPLGWLERVPTYKEKKLELEDRDLNNYGFLGYPVLMSADILLYRAASVPVGIDQAPHLEITREIARRFNHLYNTNTLVEPEALLTEFPKVIGVDGRKMSKTYDNALYLSDTPKVIENKIKTMKTDPARQRRTDKGDPRLSPVFELHKIFSSVEEREFVTNGCKTAEIGCLDCKKILIKNIVDVLTPIWERREHFKSQGILGDILKEGNDRAGKAAEETMELIRADMKLI